MTVSVLAFYVRRPDMSPTEFKQYMEQEHIPILKEVMGVHYPTTFIRRYVERASSGMGKRLGAPAGDATAPVVLVGSPNELGWDLMAEFVFRDELHLQQCYAKINAPEGQKMKDDEDKFTVPESLKVVLLGESTAA